MIVGLNRQCLAVRLLAHASAPIADILLAARKLTLQSSYGHGAVNPLIRYYLAKQAEQRGEPYGNFQAMYHIAEDKLGLRQPGKLHGDDVCVSRQPTTSGATQCLPLGARKRQKRMP